MVRLLFIDDDPKAQKILDMALPDYHVISAYTAEEGFRAVTDEDPDVVLLDIDLPDQDGIELLARLQAVPAPPPVIMVTGFSDTRLVVRAIKAGAYDYLVKPYETEHLTGTIRQALQSHIPALQSAPGRGADRLVGESVPIRRVKSLIHRFGPSGAPILVHGESGTGKELVARAIHEVSGRPGPFVPINCGAIPETLFESELFGSVRGAYTDALTREGAFELANRGSLFLDEIGEMPFPAQVKLLRVLEEKRVRRLGSAETVRLNVRVIAATQRDLKRQIRRNAFREDLFYRLGVLHIEIPPLRERRDDIGLLSSCFLQESGKRLGGGALEKLTAHGWPGNVRELRNVMERAALLADDRLIAAPGIVFD